MVWVSKASIFCTRWVRHVRIGSPFSTVAAQPVVLDREENGIRFITLNNPKQRNALSLEMMKCLLEALKLKESTRVIIIDANGPVFSSGHNLKEMNNSDCKLHDDVFSKCSSLMNLVQDLPVPVIAQVNGLATAAGCQLVASCDVALATEKSQFATPGVSIGLFCSTPGIALARAVPRKIAMEMLLTGRPISAADALKHGLVSKVVSEENLENETMMIANRICETSKPVIALGKKFFYEQIEMGRKEAYRNGEKVMVNNLKLPDAKEGIAAFVGKRHPKWTHLPE